MLPLRLVTSAVFCVGPPQCESWHHAVVVLYADRFALAIVASHLAACSSSSSAPTCDETRAPCPTACTYAPDGRLLGCDFAIPSEPFDPDYFYCHVEPEFIVAYKCGPGDPSKGDAPGGCHFGTAVSGMNLLEHPPVNCQGGDKPLDPSLVAAGTPANTDMQSVELEFSRTYKTAPLLLRPSAAGPASHPRAVFAADDPTVNQLLSAWASK